MKFSNPEIFHALQSKLKIGNRRGVHLNAIPGNSRYKFDLNRLSAIYASLPERFIIELLTQKNINFKFSTYDKSNTIEDSETKYKGIENKGTSDNQEISHQTKDEKLDRLVKSLENLIFQNEVIVSEKGINTLGFGFPLLIRKDLADGQITSAPLLIWSIKITPSSEMNTWTISRTEDDPIYLNEVLINHLQNDSSVILDPIPEEMLEDGKLDKPELFAICSRILEQLKIEQNLDFILNNYEPINPIKSKVSYDKQLIDKGDGIIEKSGIFSLFEVQKQNIINDYESLKKEFKEIERKSTKEFQSITAIETDPSQQNVLESLKTESNILIQGPPGTGKSQTLTALLINALENKQKTIVVCEKQTALEVLYQALEKKGLDKYCIMVKDSITDRKLVVDKVRNTIDNVQFKKAIEIYPDAVLKTQVDEIQNSIKKINAIHHKLNNEEIATKDWSEIIGEILQFDSEKELIDLTTIQFQFNEQEFSDLNFLLENGELLYRDFEKYRENPFYNPNTILKENPINVHENIKESFQKYSSDLEEIIKLKNQYQNYYNEKRKEEFSNQLEDLNHLLNESEITTSTLDQNSKVFDQKTDSLWFKISAIFSSSNKKAIQQRKSLQEIGQKIKAISLHHNFQPIEISSNLWENQLAYKNYRTSIEETKTNFNQKIEQDFDDFDLLNVYDKNLLNTDLNQIKSKIDALRRKISTDHWITELNFGSQYKEFEKQIKTTLEKYDELENDSNNSFLIIYNWFEFYKNLNDFQLKCFEKIVNYPNWKSTFLAAYYRLLLKAKADGSLNFDEKEYQNLIKNIHYFASSQKTYIEKFWDLAQQQAVKKFESDNKEITVPNLYNKRRSEKFARLSLRQIVKKDTDLFTNFFPIILTTPDACSNLFQGKNYYFDHVVFDEASQLKLEDNLPAMLKAKNIIIAGDEHQMPPSNYFGKVFEGSIEDEDDMEDEQEIVTNKNALLSIESLLDFALEYQFDKNHLDFHYRSRHPYLIDFSNHAFYNSRLKPLPTKSEEKPIEFFQVNGFFQDHINEEEAEKVIEILNSIEPKKDGTYPSVGIATFNITQRNYIKRKIIQKINESNDEHFKEKIQGLETAGLFIKNLENIQGDERDIIILSVTYGRKKDGKFIQSFGPINHSKGYKLLNVIITRAKEKIYVCNSIPEEFFSNYKEALLIEKSNNRRAVFYAYLAYCKAVNDENETHRLEILKNLDIHGYQEKNQDEKNINLFKDEFYKRLKAKYPNYKIQQDYAFGGYTIDFIIESENKSLAIETMSKENYSTSIAYLEDLHKEKIIKQSGLDYVRIWSHLTWQNIDLELNKINKFL